MQCNHQLQNNLHYPAFLSPLPPQLCFRRASKRRPTRFTKRCTSFCSKANKAAPFLGYVHMNICLDVNSINLSFSMLTGLQPTHSRFAHFRHACYLQNFSEIFYFESLSLHLDKFLSPSSFPYFKCEWIMIEIADHKRRKTNTSKTKKEKEQWQRENLLNQRRLRK